MRMKRSMNAFGPAMVELGRGLNSDVRAFFLRITSDDPASFPRDLLAIWHLIMCCHMIAY